ncbi:hypothetical protein ACWEQ3_03495 [Streptomyces mirabilis]
MREVVMAVCRDGVDRVSASSVMAVELAKVDRVHVVPAGGGLGEVAGEAVLGEDGEVGVVGVVAVGGQDGAQAVEAFEVGDAARRSPSPESPSARP